MKISIVTVAYNSEAYIRDCLESVQNQSYDKVEHIIVDGFSSDNTMSIVKDYDVVSISEPDINMYDAINKGISMSSGDYILILNSDDFLVSEDAISSFVKKASKESNYLGFYCNRIDVNKQGKFKRLRRSFQLPRWMLLYSRNLTFISHPTLFVKKSIVSELGGYNIEFNYASDLDFVLRLMERNKLKYLNIEISAFRVHDESITASGKIYEEKREILRRNLNIFDLFMSKLLYYPIWTIYVVINHQWYLRKILKS
jgi:glycosyltransferase involved in cell wall biosynthesis